MKKILILSYFFPPCNLTASQRAYGWAKYLKNFGFYPIILTRNWDQPLETNVDLVKSSGNEVHIEKNEDYTVYYLPYRANLRDRILIRASVNPLVVAFGKILTLIELVFQNFTTRVLPYHGFLKMGKQIIEEESVAALIVTGNPFTMFRFGDLLGRRFKIPWIADYRDDWTTGELTVNGGLIRKFLLVLEKKSELKWLASSSGFTTISKHYRNKIQRFIDRPGTVLYNGYFKEDFEFSTLEIQNERFVVLYNGTLYHSQPIEIFLNAFKRFIDSLEEQDKKHVQLTFMGLAFHKAQEMRVKAALRGYEECFKITARMDREMALSIQQEANVLMMVAHKGIKGVPSSKIFEYFGLKKPVLLVHSDQDILGELVSGYNLGEIANTELEVLRYLMTKFDEYKRGHKPKPVDETYVQQFDRLSQTRILGDLLNQVIK